MTELDALSVTLMENAEVPVDAGVPVIAPAELSASPRRQFAEGHRPEIRGAAAGRSQELGILQPRWRPEGSGEAVVIANEVLP